MIDAVLADNSTTEVRDLAQTMKANQTADIPVMGNLLTPLGATPCASSSMIRSDRGSPQIPYRTGSCVFSTSPAMRIGILLVIRRNVFVRAGPATPPARAV